MILTIIITASQHVPHFIFLYKLEYVIDEENDFTDNKLVKTGRSTIFEQHPPVGVAQKKKKKTKARHPLLLPSRRFMDNIRIVYEN